MFCEVWHCHGCRLGTGMCDKAVGHVWSCCSELLQQAGRDGRTVQGCVSQAHLIQDIQVSGEIWDPSSYP